jgi:hypothetical protein
VAASTGEGARAPSPAHEQPCQEPGCTQPRWTIYRRSAPVAVSAYCSEHSHVRMLDVPVVRPPAKATPAAVFREEVERRRLERERAGRALALLLQGRREGS